MSATVAETEKGNTIPGTENFPVEVNGTKPASPTAIQRVLDYPLAKEATSTAYSYVQGNSYSKALYDKAETILTEQVLPRLEPIQKRLPLETANGYANSGLDFLESKVPAVKTADTKEIIGVVRKPADDAAGIAKSYADGIQKNQIAPIQEAVAVRIAKSQEALAALQKRLTETVASIPHDKASAQEAIGALVQEFEKTVTYVTKDLPATAQSASKPYIDGLGEGITHIREELSKPDVPFNTKVKNVLSYTQEQVSPILNSIVELVSKKKTEATDKVDEVKTNGVKA